MKSILLVHPSRSRPKQAIQTASKWLSSAANKDNITYLFALDKDDPCLYEYMGDTLDTSIENYIGETKNAIEAINSCTQYANKSINWDLIICPSDDFQLPPFHWDAMLLDATKGYEDFVLKTQDGIQKLLVTLPIMDRKYYQSKGYIYYPEYQHMFCDQEMTAVAFMEGKLLISDIKIPHHHYSTGKFAKDAISVKNDATWNQGQALFNKRKAINFGIANPVQPYPTQW